MIKNLIAYFAFILAMYFILKITFDYFDKSNKIDTYDLEGYIYKKNFSLKSLSKPIIFIHLPNNTRLVPLEHRDITKVPEINDAILYLNIKSVIRHCGKSYDIVIFDNTNVIDLLDDDSDDIISTTRLTHISGQNQTNWENYAKCKILYKYGGIMMEPDFYFTNQINPHIFKTKQLKITSYANEGVHVSNKHSIPHFNKLMIAQKYDPDLEILMQYIAAIYEYQYDNTLMKFDNMHDKLSQLHLLDPKMFGIQDKEDNIIQLRDWMSANKEMILDENSFCIYINRDLLQRSRHYGWMLNMSESQILNSNTNIGKFMNQN